MCIDFWFLISIDTLSWHSLIHRHRIIHSCVCASRQNVLSTFKDCCRCRFRFLITIHHSQFTNRIIAQYNSYDPFISSRIQTLQIVSAASSRKLNSSRTTVHTALQYAERKDSKVLGWLLSQRKRIKVDFEGMDRPTNTWYSWIHLIPSTNTRVQQAEWC